MKKVRVALFEKVSDKITGYFLESGKVMYFNSIIDFAKEKDTLWITNLPSTILNDNKTRIKGDGYLDIYLKDILYEVNALDKDISLQLKVLQKVVASVFFALKSKYNIGFGELENVSHIHKAIKSKVDFNSSFINELLLPSEEMIDIFKGISYSIETISSLTNDKSKSCIVYYPRYNHVLNLCKLRLPLNTWVPFPVEKITKSDKTPEEWVTSVGKKFLFLVKCKFSNLDKEISEIFKNRLNEVSEGWFISPEIEFLSNYGNFSIKDICISSNNESLVLFAKNKLFKETNVLNINSINNGIVARSYLKSILSDDKLKIQKNWVNVYDKLMMSKIAVYLKHYGFNVLSFGKGAIKVEYNDDNKIELKKICDNLNLMNNLKIK